MGGESNAIPKWMSLAVVMAALILTRAAISRANLLAPLCPPRAGMTELKSSATTTTTATGSATVPLTTTTTTTAH